MERVEDKLAKEVVGDGDVRGVAAHKRHRKHKAPKEEERTKKHKGPKDKERTKKYKGDMKQPKEEERAKKLKEEGMKNKHTGDEAMKLKVVLGDESKMRKTKLVTVRSSLPLEDVLIDEIVDYMASGPLRAHTECRDAVFDEDSSISEYYKEMREFNASVLQQYRIKGCADLHLEVNDEEEVSHDEEHKAPKEEEERTKKHKSDEATKFKVVVVAGSKQKLGGKRRKTKVVTWRLSEELLDYLRTKEVMGLLATETPRSLPSISDELFDPKLREEIVAEFKENRGFDAYVLYQYRTKGYAEIQEVTDDACV